LILARDEETIVMKRGIWWLSIGLAVFLTGCGDQVCKPEADARTDVHALYKQSCAGCHGEQLQGVSGPSLKHAGAVFSKEDLVSIINDGRPGMPGFKDKLDETQLTRLVIMLSNER
jgi:cytochrome c551